MSFISWAENFEDVMLWRVLQHVEQGFWIDIGAAEPDLFSVTRAFSERGWRGINVEPAPRPFKLLVRQRPRDINLQIAVGRENGQTILNLVGDGNGLTTTDPTLAALYAEQGHAVTKVPVTVKTLKDICSSHANDKIHFLKIDVEGDERSVLLGADFLSFRPWVVLIEATCPNSATENWDAWHDILEREQYTFVYFDGLNRFYVAHEKEADLAPKFRSPPNVFDAFSRIDEVRARDRAARAEIRAVEAETRASQAMREVEEANRRTGEVRADLEIAYLRALGADAQRAQAQAKAEAAVNELAAVLRSSSWRITGLFRRVGAHSKRWRRPARIATLRRLINNRLLSKPEVVTIVATPIEKIKKYAWQTENPSLLDDEGMMAVRAYVRLSNVKPAFVEERTPGHAE